MGTITAEGKSKLFNSGWTSNITKAYLYTSSDVLVNTQDVTFTYSGGYLQPSADIVFSVAAGVTNVAKVQIGYTFTNPLPPNQTLFASLYEEALDTTYNFATAGTLTIDSWQINIAGTSLVAAGKEALFTTGWGTAITKAKLYTSGNVLVNTQTVDFDVVSYSGGTDYKLEVDAPIVFSVSTTTSNITYITLTKTDDTVLYSRTLPSPAPYNFTTPGTLTVPTWVITI